jgi:hypothetical protein
MVMATQRSARMDAQDQYFLSNQLQSFDPTSYYHLVPGVVGRKLIPAIDGVSKNMPVYKFKMVRLRGQVKMGGPRTKGQSSVSAIRTEETQAIKILEDDMTYNIDELRAAQEAGQDLPKDTQLAAVTAIEQKIDSMLALGDTLSGIPGIANNANVPNTNATATWLAAATPDQIIGDVTNIISLTQDALKQGQIPGQEIPFFDQFSLFLPVKHLTKIMTTRLGATNDITIYKFIVENFAMLKSIRPWWRLDTANGGNPMAVLVPALDNGQMNPFAGGALLPMDFEMLPEQYDGRDINIPCAGKCGGVVIRHPVAFRTLKVM